MVMPTIPIIVPTLVARSGGLFIQYRDRTVIAMMMMLIDRHWGGKVRDLVPVPRRRRPGERQGNHGESQKDAE